MFSLAVATNGKEREIITVQSWLIQLGFGDPVKMICPGTEIKIDNKMRRMIAKFSVHRGWHEGEHPGSLLVTYIQKYINEFAVDDINRESKVLLHFFAIQRKSALFSKVPEKEFFPR